MPSKKKKPAKKSPRKKIIKRTPPKKIIKRKPAKKALKKKPAAKTKENIIGKITHYFPKVRAAVIKLKAPLKVGDTIKIKGHTTDFKQKVTSMQIDRIPIDQAKKGAEIGILVESRSRQHDTVYLVHSA